jgi:uncharacterized protein YcgI (DUF1989 family)
MRLGKRRVELVLPPVTGKALSVYKGEVLRISQVVGGQCVDFNCFNLHDYKEYMSVGHMRKQGLRIHAGDYVFSAPPRSNIMMSIESAAESCVTDLIGARCCADMFEATWGLDFHTNCQDTLAEAIREYGLSPDDTHDSFNMWMNTKWEPDGAWGVAGLNPGDPGDAVDLLATMDVLAVPLVCGSGDISGISNFFLSPIQVEVFAPSDETRARVDEHLLKWGGLRNQRSLDQYRITTIRTERELAPDPSYEPEYPSFPLGTEDLDIALTGEEAGWLREMVEKGLAHDEPQALRAAIFEWYGAHHSTPNPFGVRGLLGDERRHAEL